MRDIDLRSDKHDGEEAGTPVGVDDGDGAHSAADAAAAAAASRRRRGEAGPAVSVTVLEGSLRTAVPAGSAAGPAAAPAAEASGTSSPDGPLVWDGPAPSTPSRRPARTPADRTPERLTVPGPALLPAGPRVAAAASSPGWAAKDWPSDSPGRADAPAMTPPPSGVGAAAAGSPTSLPQRGQGGAALPASASVGSTDGHGSLATPAAKTTRLRSAGASGAGPG